MNTRTPSMKRRLLWSAELCMEWAGITQKYSMTRRGAVILMYHSITTPRIAPFVDPRVQVSAKVFEEQMKMISEIRTPIAMDDIVSGIKNRSLPRHGVAVTFDDGYLDTLTVAAPILAKYRIPAMVIFPTDYVDTRAPQWIDRLNHVFARRTRDRLVLLDGSC